MLQDLPSFWCLPAAQVLDQLKSSLQGLSQAEAQQRLTQYGTNSLKQKRQSHTLVLLLNQFKSPIILILIAAAILSSFLGDALDAVIILAIVLVSGLLGFWQERGAADAIQKLLALVEVKARILREGQLQDIAIADVVPGDVVQVSAGDSIPGDCLILESQMLSVDEATLTGETYPVSKEPGVLPVETGLSQRINSLLMGTHVVSGSAQAVVVHTGKLTEFGKVSERLKFRPPETEFESGIRKFGYFLVEVTLILVVLIFAANVYLQRPMLDSFLFSLALAVGLTPQLLPAIVSINLSHGAKQMATRQVIVKRLPAIENFGSMNVLCSDKTGTLTDGTVRIRSALDVDGNESQQVLFYAYLNAATESGYVNPIDEAIRTHQTFDISAYQKLGEIPYDFNRKRLSILFAKESDRLLVTKGSLTNILDICTSVKQADGTAVDLEPLRSQIQQRAEMLGSEGSRILGVAYRSLTTDELSIQDETNLTFLGYLALYDPPKSDIKGTIADLAALGVTLKMITGDSHAVAASIAQQVGLLKTPILTGAALQKLSDAALLHQVNQVNVFAEVEPNQKERIIVALKKAGNVVGYMGDGINDASALYAADVGISVDTAVDVAKEAADIVLMQKDLDVLLGGIKSGRTTFANTLKYVFMATSANFGNMFSMAGVSLMLPFLPLLPKQILLTNLFTDFPEMTIATDRVDQEQVTRPHRWDIRFIRNFMLVFGLLSSVFDYLTFAALLLLLHADPAQFRTGWFMESVISASIIVLVFRTHQSMFHSKPSPYLFWTTIAIDIVTVILPYTPLAPLLGFQPLSIEFLLVLLAIVALYILSAEIVKQLFYQHLQV
ncbi:magnesium-translocating P-type ATPase (plasmid) [Kovacikia minuta CCNUW1]|uniref:magnesium-translocating P-type ATPase n=1 Tax=Kovacikia minuta TaxID=2931930 RepID=UPI001CCB2A4E|nr:magnesium-translocating P-type ATPase [Kovacikia minuta]UBF29788.1 magnesium-translocating P-type ATPase [Kovacikia minuta CCNUW1]